MKKLITLLFPVLLSLTVLAGSPIKKSDLRVLYVGGASDKEPGACVSEEEYQASVKARMASFEAFLKEYNKTKKFDIIISKAGDNLLYANPKYDITNDVVKGLNKRYKTSPELEKKLSGK